MLLKQARFGNVILSGGGVTGVIGFTEDSRVVAMTCLIDVEMVVVVVSRFVWMELRGGEEIATVSHQIAAVPL
jgi:hypothetical protein